MASSSPELSTVPKIAVPTVAPTLRKNWRAAVATPRSLRATAFCTTSVYCCDSAPSPTPISPTPPTTSHADEVALSRASSNTPTPSSTAPTSISSLYRPVRVMVMPASSPTSTRPSISGSVINPEVDAFTASTPWA